MHERAGDGDALAHAAGEGANERGAAFVEADFAKEFFGAGGGLRDALKFGEEDEVLFGREFVVDHGGVRDVTWPAIARGFGGRAGEGQLPCRGADDAGGDAEESGFSGAVATGEDDIFARSDFKGDAAKSEKTAKTFIDVFEEETGWRWRRQGFFRLGGAPKNSIVSRGLEPQIPQRLKPGFRQVLMSELKLRPPKEKTRKPKMAA